MNTISYSSQVPVHASYDVLVIGGGPSGLCAAVAAARSGARTAVMERYGTLGGNLTLGHVGPIMGQVAPGTLGTEINRMAGTKMPINRIAHDNERLKQGLAKWVKASGASILLQCAMADVLMAGDQITGVVAATPEGLKAFHAAVVIDATGDGLVGFRAGAPFIMGRDADQLMQPVSLMFSMGGLDDDKLLREGNNTFDPATRSPEFRATTIAASQVGLLPRASSFVRIYRTYRDNECYINATHKNFVDGTRLDEIEAAELALRDQIPWIAEYLKKNVPGFENSYVLNSASTLGVRESRRIQGEYVLNEADLRAGRRFEDVVVHHANFYFDVHGMKSGGQDSVEPVKGYDIPYRSLVPQKVENLLVVGRCISGTHLAHASYRVMNIAMAIGQAGGVAGALAAANGISPRALDPHLIQQALTRMGVELYD